MPGEADRYYGSAVPCPADEPARGESPLRYLDVWSAAYLQAKSENDSLVRANVFGLQLGQAPLAMMDSACFLPIKYLDLNGPYEISGLESAGSTVVPSQYSTSRPGRRSSIPIQRQAALTWSGIRYVSFFERTAHTFRSAYLPGQRSRCSDERERATAP